MGKKGKKKQINKRPKLEARIRTATYLRIEEIVSAAIVEQKIVAMPTMRME